MASYMHNQESQNSANIEIRYAYKRMLIGAAIGFILFGGLLFLKLWFDGWFHRVPMFTMPPGMAVMLVGCIGAAIGAVVSLFSKKWKQFDS
jgi:hypothetical protein